MRGITENEIDILLLVLLLLTVLASLTGSFPLLNKIFPSLMSGMFRVMDMIKDAVPVLSYI
jgi:hypothetical protein